MILLEDVSFGYGGDSNKDKNLSIKNINLKIPKGQVLLLCGESGCGKTTITRLINGLIPNYYEGNLEGRIEVEGLNIKETTLENLSVKVGSVFQNPRTQFFNVNTTDELVFGCENSGMTLFQSRHIFHKKIGRDNKYLEKLWENYNYCRAQDSLSHKYK